MLNPQTTPTRLHLKKDQQLEIDWQDGLTSIYPISYLRSMCPCASCKLIREGSDPHDLSPTQKKKPLLTILPGNYSGQVTVAAAQMVGNYAIKLTFSDGHDTGIYSFEYLRQISPQKPDASGGR
ncbi:MAG TPA: DUF971 domain-containing protein [Tepidisphaeraceae bacterium]|nr:DUF971 domain-containing protein [Tepidisphaeraceae bacterium]